MELAIARKNAEFIVSELSPWCERIEIAGSIRRGRPQVNDIDLVILPKDIEAIKARCKRTNPNVLQDGAENFSVVLPKIGQLDIFFALPKQTELFRTVPTNWGSLMVLRTGSRSFNIWLCEFAKQKGYYWNPNRGLVRNGQIIASAEERDIFDMLGTPYVQPEKRG